MSLERVKILTSKQYDFVNRDTHLGNNVIYLTLSGSHAYGTDTANSDIDVRGITIENKEEVLGLSNFEQYEDKNTDTVIYGLKKFISLALKGNPNVLELLGTRNEDILRINEYGKLIRDNSEVFLSKRVINTFGNYASAQLRRLQNSLARDYYPQEEKEKHILNSINNQMEHFKANYSKFKDGSINLYIGQSSKEEMETEIFMDLDLRHYPVRDFTGIYSEMSNIIRDYSKLNHRNRKKDTDKLNKHAMHLIRILTTGTEILKGNGIITYRESEIPMFMDIRNGKLDNKQIFEMVDEYEKKFKDAADNTKLPDQPNSQKAEKLLMDIYSRYYLI